eukprot:3126257-Amphidinium_carterae.1
MGASPPPLTTGEWNWLRQRHVEDGALVHYSTDAAKAYGSDIVTHPGVPGHNAVVHTGPKPQFAEAQGCTVQLGPRRVDYVAQIGTQKMDCLWKWMKRGVET